MIGNLISLTTLQKNTIVKSKAKYFKAEIFISMLFTAWIKDFNWFPISIQRSFDQKHNMHNKEACEVFGLKTVAASLYWAEATPAEYAISDWERRYGSSDRFYLHFAAFWNRLSLWLSAGEFSSSTPYLCVLCKQIWRLIILWKFLNFNFGSKSPRHDMQITIFSRLTWIQVSACSIISVDSDFQKYQDKVLKRSRRTIPWFRMLKLNI